jgi:hypothetical protein
MKELRCLHFVLNRIGIQIQAEYLPSAVNWFADRLSRLANLDDWRINPVPIQHLLLKIADRPICRRKNLTLSQVQLRTPCPGKQGSGLVQPVLGRSSEFLEPSHHRLLPLGVEIISREHALGVLV